ncbi:MAG: hypothetical protein ACRDI0_10005 [Actinomycetota bacterium]
MAATWTVIGLLGVALGVMVTVYFRLGSRIDAQGRDLRAAIDALGRDLRAAIEAQGRDLRAAIDAQTARIDAMSARIDTHLDRHAG